jgi:hypothetical protein
LQYFQHAGTNDRHVLLGQLFEDSKHDFLFAHRRGVFDLQAFGIFQQLRRGLGLELIKVHGLDVGIARLEIVFFKNIRHIVAAIVAVVAIIPAMMASGMTCVLNHWKVSFVRRI